MRSVLATDLDGTVVFPGGVRDADAGALRRWSAAGNALVLDTGKSVDATRIVWSDDRLPVPDYVIAFTGAMITDGHFHPLRWSAHEPGLLDDIRALVADEPVVLFASDLEHDYVVFNHVGSTSPIIPRFYDADLDHLRNAPLFGIPIHTPDPAVLARVEGPLRELCAGRAEVHHNQDFLDVVPAGASKGSGLRRVLTDLLPGHGTVYTLGDSWNDLPMHEVADVSATLRHAPAELCDRCDRIVDSAAQLIDQLLTPNPQEKR